MRFSRILAVVLTAGPDNDPSPDSWPVDFNDDQVVTGSDILKLGSVFGSNELATPPPPYNARMDFNDDGLITGSDVLSSVATSERGVPDSADEWNGRTIPRAPRSEFRGHTQLSPSSYRPLTLPCARAATVMGR